MLVAASAAQSAVIDFTEGDAATSGAAFAETVSWTVAAEADRRGFERRERTDAIRVVATFRERVREVRREAREGGSESAVPGSDILLPVLERPEGPRLTEQPLGAVELAAVPVPAAGLLLLGGLGALVLLRRRGFA